MNRHEMRRWPDGHWAPAGYPGLEQCRRSAVRQHPARRGNDEGASRRIIIIMVRVFYDPDSCEAIEDTDLPYSDRYHYCDGDALRLPVTMIGRPVWVFLSGGKNGAAGKKKLFQRATVQAVLIDEDRVRVEYPSGATYKVRPALLEGILAADLFSGNDDDDNDKSSSSASELLLPPPRNHNNNHNNCNNNHHNKHHVLLYRETDAYRRACVIHCGPNETFCEIGCAEGIACEKIRQTGCPQHRRLVAPVGIDKSNVCIDEAKRRYPACQFIRADIFATEEGDDDCFHWPTFAPQVVAIDINGTRELEAVLSAVELVIRHWQPRLVLVKSRALYHAAVSNNNRQRNDPTDNSSTTAQT
jgi:hypothetical protein